MAWRCRLLTARRSAATSSLRNDLVKNCRVHPTHWLISTQVIVDKGSICGWARRNRRNPREKALSKRIAEKGGLGGGLAAAAASAKKRKKTKKR